MTATQAPPTFSSAEVCRQTGISYRQLDNWARRGHLRWTWRNRDGRVVTHGGSGMERRFTSDEVDRARMMARLVALGISAQQAAKVARDPTCRWGWLADVMAACKAMQP